MLVKLRPNPLTAQTLTQVLAVDPNEVSALLYLGQLLQGQASLAHYQKAVEVMTAELGRLQAAAAAGTAPPDAASSAARLRRRISCAYCSITELCMTDLADEEGAEATCEASLASAVEVDPSSPEAYAQLASLRLVQQRGEEAVPLVRKAAELLGPLLEAADAAASEGGGAKGGLQGAAGHSADAAAGSDMVWTPTFNSRKALAQSALEVNELTIACELLERLLSESDTDFEVWFLLAEAYLSAGDFGSAGMYINEATRRLAAAEAVGAGRRAGGAPAAAGSGGGGSLFGVLAAAAANGDAVAVLKDMGLPGVQAALKQFGLLADAVRQAAAAKGVDLAAAIAAAEAEGGDEGGDGDAELGGLRTAVGSAVAAAQGV